LWGGFRRGPEKSNEKGGVAWQNQRLAPDSIRGAFGFALNFLWLLSLFQDKESDKSKINEICSNFIRPPILLSMTFFACLPVGRLLGTCPDDNRDVRTKK
jgi:hypothetical protein